MNKSAYNQILMMAAASYYDVLCVLLEMLHQNATTLGLMVPGVPEQLAVNNGVGVAANGRPLFLADVVVREKKFRSELAFGNAVQAALDETAYSNCVARLVLRRVNQMSPKVFRLTLMM